MEVISREQILAALKKANPLIQEAFGSDETVATILKIQKRYNLHADVLGAVSQELGNLLLGLIDPTAFFSRIQERGVNDEAAKSIVEDVNREIFIPLQKKIKDGVKVKDDEEDDFVPPAAPVTPETRVESPAPSNPPQVPVMSLKPTEVPKVESPETLAPIAPAPAAAPQEPPAYNLIRPELELQVPRPQAPIEAVALPHARTMAGDVNALTHPESAAPDAGQGTMPTVPHPWQTSPAQSFQTASVPYTSMPVSSRAVPAPPPVQLPTSWAPAPTTTAELPAFKPVSNPAPLNPRIEALTKEYGSDPYREPIN
jgi:hypothetical protein